MVKKSSQKFKYLENEKSFKDEIKSILHLKGLSLNQIKQYFWESWESEFTKRHSEFFRVIKNLALESTEPL